MIDINLLPPERRPAGAGVLAKAAVVILLLALIILGAAAAWYARSILPALEKERSDLLAVYEQERRRSDPARRKAAERLLRGRAVWTRALADAKTATNAAAERGGAAGPWLNRVTASGNGFELRCRIAGDGVDAAMVESVSGLITSGIPEDSPLGPFRSGAAVREGDPPVWRLTLSGAAKREW